MVSLKKMYEKINKQTNTSSVRARNVKKWIDK